jgi:hypothetical protein
MVAEDLPARVPAAGQFRPWERNSGHRRLRNKPLADSREVAMQVAIIALIAALMSTAALSQQSDDDSSLMIGPWRIEVVMKGNKFDRCSMSRKANDDTNATILRASDGLTLILDSSKWKLERGKQYPVDLAIGSRRWPTRASADQDAVTIALTDSALVDMIRKANTLEVRGEDKSMAALDRLETCFEKNSRSPETNPFVAPGRNP